MITGNTCSIALHIHASFRTASKMSSLYSVCKRDTENSTPKETILPIGKKISISSYCKIAFRFQSAAQRHQLWTLNCGNKEILYFLKEEVVGYFFPSSVAEFSRISQLPRFSFAKYSSIISIPVLSSL